MLQAAEAARRKAEEEVGKVRATSSAAVDRAEAQLRTSQERLHAAETSAKARETEVPISCRDDDIQMIPSQCAGGDKGAGSHKQAMSSLQASRLLRRT